jgi:fructose-specific component phosphotransferase system IIB-like protein
MRFKEFFIEQDPAYDDGADQLGKNPYMQKVNAYTANITDPDTRKYIHKLEPMSAQELAQWKTRAAKLLARCNAIYANLKGVMPPEDTSAVTGVKIIVPLEGNGNWASASFDDKIISFDVGCFWDLSDDCLAYVMGHEMGHMVWAFGPKKNWPKLRGQKNVTPAQRRQEEMDADVYGCRLAMQLGYDRRKAFDHFTVAYQREPFDPGVPYYPSVGQRKANVEKDIKSRADAAAQAQQKTAEPQAAPEPQQPNPDMAGKNAWLGHIMNAVRSFDVALANTPQQAQA